LVYPELFFECITSCKILRLIMGNGRFIVIILNFIGGTTRYLFGNIWSNIFNRKKFKYTEYLNGPENPTLHDQIGHRFNNIVSFP
jgi:hypothetical protein